MDHIEAVQQMAAERYLLGELSLEVREAFEAHLFECPECAFDLRAGAVFIEEAKAQLPELTRPSSAQDSGPKREPKKKRGWWLSWMQPAFAVPAFATLLTIICYQNFVTYPALRASANQPRILPWVPLHGATRSGAPLAISADRRHGVALPVELPAQPSAGAYSSYSFDLLDSHGKLAWSGSTLARADESGENERLSLMIPGAMLQSGSYTVAVTGIAATGERAAVDKFSFDLQITD